MKVFISWSGNVSQQIAQEIRRWLPLILPTLEPFITSTDIEKGTRWQGEISRELEESNYGIVCLTGQNLHSQWLAFEAGALSKQLGGRVATILFGVGHAEVQPPLSMFQGTLFNEQDMRQLVIAMNAAAPVEQRREDGQIEVLFQILWPKLRDPISLIIEGAAQADGEQPPAPNIEEMAVEILALLRQQNSVLSAPERFLAPIMDRLDSLAGSERREEVARVRRIPPPPPRRPWHKEEQREKVTEAEAGPGSPTNDLDL